LHAIEEVKTGEVDDVATAWPFVRAEEDGGRKDPLEAGDQAAVMRPVFGKAEEIE
jgi:hypothetical protein